MGDCGTRFVLGDREELQSLATSVIQKVSTQEINRDAALATLFETQMRVAASYWQKCLRQMSAEWSPWMDETISTKWKLSKHVDSKSRRMLLVHNFDYQSHDDAAYQDRGEKYQQLPNLDQSLGDLKVQDITKEVSGAGLEETESVATDSRASTSAARACWYYYYYYFSNGLTDGLLGFRHKFLPQV
jgi:hypothetical protein